MVPAPTKQIWNATEKRRKQTKLAISVSALIPGYKLLCSGMNAENILIYEKEVNTMLTAYIICSGLTAAYIGSMFIVFRQH